MNKVELAELAAGAPNRPRRDVVLRAIEPAIATEITLARAPFPILKEAARMIQSQAMPIAKEIREEIAFQQRKDAQDQGRAQVLAYFFTRLREYLGPRFDGLAPIVMDQLMKEEERNRKAFRNAVKQDLGIDLQTIMRADDVRSQIELAMERYVGLIKGVGDEVIKKAQFTILDSANKAEGQKVLAKRLNKEFGWGMKRSRFIARDQLATFNGTLNKVRQEQAGVEEYVWATARDERVRPEHARRNGKTFRWDSPPSDGHPGEPINCRCVAKAVIKF